METKKREEMVVPNGWIKYVVVGTERDIEYGWVQKN